MTPGESIQQYRKLSCQCLPLAVYREIAAHLQQVEGVKAELIPQTFTKFDYQQSQIKAIYLKYPENISSQDQQRVEEILEYYANVHGSWVDIQ